MQERQNGTEDEVVVGFTSFPDEEIAGQIGTHWVESQLAACVTLLPGARSIYRWEGKTERAAEVLALLKTTRGRLAGLEASLRDLHPYELPEWIVLGSEDGSETFRDWVRRQTTVDKAGS